MLGLPMTKLVCHGDILKKSVIQRRVEREKRYGKSSTSTSLEKDLDEKFEDGDKVTQNLISIWN